LKECEGCLNRKENLGSCDANLLEEGKKGDIFGGHHATTQHMTSMDDTYLKREFVQLQVHLTAPKPSNKRATQRDGMVIRGVEGKRA
jgi:hypothetical protein